MKWKCGVAINVRRWTGNVGGNYNRMRILAVDQMNAQILVL
jgi:hypothetical protein